MEERGELVWLVSSQMLMRGDSGTGTGTVPVDVMRSRERHILVLISALAIYCFHGVSRPPAASCVLVHMSRRFLDVSHCTRLDSEVYYCTIQGMKNQGTMKGGINCFRLRFTDVINSTSLPLRIGSPASFCAVSTNQRDPEKDVILLGRRHAY